ncbi:ABC transporter substrate-binding protein [Pararhodobacter sp. CCB-MM2]|uniref:ABC transporter substrate-binding protein n=1 Tax=Pararhodobacter sp. CCB-MM2 TaxID=1786003 RepID=UPI000AACDB7B|nr:ABC transporter substrate-binding protein [Pararhodobacter sp. CCB-MM2]
MTQKTKTTLLMTRRQALIAGSAAALAAPLYARSSFAQSNVINVGVIQPLSGANAQFGINSRNGIQLVADEINANGGIAALGGAQINLVISDATSNPTQAATVAQRMMSQDNVVAVLGAFASSLTLAISEVTERRRVPLLTMSFADQVTGRGFRNIFQVVSKASALGGATVTHTRDLARANGTEISRIAIMYEDTAYGTAQANGLRNSAAANGIEVVMDEAYPLGITDVSPLINQLRRTEAQVVFPVSYLNDSLLIIRNMRQQGITTPTVGGAAGYIIPDFRNGLGDLSENVLSISPAAYDQAPDYTDRFRDRFGYFMVHEAQEHAACMGVLASALEIAGEANPQAIREVLASTTFDQGWATVMSGGRIAFDETGLNIHAVPMMVQWRGDELVTVAPSEYAKAEAVWNA